MKNPLLKRLPRELRHDFAKYLILFIFLTGVIGFVSGFLVASNSMITTYNEGFDKYNIEDGNFELAEPISSEQQEALEKENVILYENLYVEPDTDDYDSTVRIFKQRKEVNKACLMEGSFPSANSEIVLDRMYAENNHIAIGDTISVNDKELTVCGYVALSDYSALYQSTSDMMFDATRFGVGMVTEETFKDFGEELFHYSYSWQYKDAPDDKTTEKEMSEDLLKTISETIYPNTVTNYIPAYANQAIQFVGGDMGSDALMFTFFLYIVIAIIAFIFVITTSNTIALEATVIGTLRASGYTKGELIRHYMTMPILITLSAALVGNILGYSIFKGVAVNLYYASYSLTTYTTLWNADAFIKTTVVPVILMLFINFFILVQKLSFSPLQFIRRDLSKNRRKKAIRLNEKLSIMTRFRTRVIFQNRSNYITLVVGIFFANVILLFGLAMPALLDKYQEEIQQNMICEYQYMLKAPVETTTKSVEKYCAGSLKTIEGKLKSEDVTLLGISDDSAYLPLHFEGEGVYISNAFSEKFHIEIGDTITLHDEFEDKDYTFKVDGIHYYPAGITVFMAQDVFNKTFDYDKDYFNAYFSHKEIKDIDTQYIATTITTEDLTKTSRQLDTSLGEVMDMFTVFGVIMFMLIIFLLSKLVIEKNAQSISMTKILGYNNQEISSLYITSTSIVVVLSLILTIPLVDWILSYAIVMMMSEYPGYLPYYVPFSAYIKVVLTGVISYAVVVFFQFRKVKKIPLDMALKNRE